MDRNIALEVDGRAVTLPDNGSSLLDALRQGLGLRSPKDGCSPQGQCGCCTVLVDGAPRVACVTPLRRVSGRRITTVDGLDEVERQRWCDAFVATGASQCGFCTPGIVVRLSGLAARSGEVVDDAAVERALAAHLCRCTGWRTILDAWHLATAPSPPSGSPGSPGSPGSSLRNVEENTTFRRPEAGWGARSAARAAARAVLEGGVPQVVGPEVVLGQGGFADDTAPLGALVAVPHAARPGEWAVGESLAEARLAADKIQGRRTTAQLRHPIDVPKGDWDLQLCTTWVEPAYLETDASWCEPGGEPAGILANGGAFGGKSTSIAPTAARELADQHGRAVRVLLSREDTVRLGAKRPPLAAGIRTDGSGIVRVARTPGIAEAITSVAPELDVVEVDVAGPPTSATLRGAGWAEALILLAAARGQRPVRITTPAGGMAEAEADESGVRIRVDGGTPLDEVVLRSYCVGAAHMALGWVRREGIAVDHAGVVGDLTIRSFGILAATDMPEVHIEVIESDRPPVNGSDAVFAAVAAAEWMRQGCPERWPTDR